MAGLQELVPVSYVVDHQMGSEHGVAHSDVPDVEVMHSHHTRNGCQSFARLFGCDVEWVSLHRPVQWLA